jgi:hypothetical protein
MVAEFKSHILARDEKGFMGIPFKRLLLAGVGGGLIFTFAKILIPDWSLPLAVAAGVGFIFLSAQQGGIPRWQRFLYYLRGSLMLLAERHPESLPGQAARMLELPAELIALDSALIFAPPMILTEANLTEWITFAQAVDADHGDGLVFIDAPLDNTPLEAK